MNTTGAWKGWISYSSAPGGKNHLSPDMRAEVERREAERTKQQGRLVCEVSVRVYEHDVMPQVSFPAGSVLGVESDPSDIAAAVARARDAMADWR